MSLQRKHEITRLDAFSDAFYGSWNGRRRRLRYERPRPAHHA